MTLLSSNAVFRPHHGRVRILPLRCRNSVQTAAAAATCKVLPVDCCLDSINRNCTVMTLRSRMQHLNHHTVEQHPTGRKVWMRKPSPKTDSIQAALGAVGKTTELAGLPNPLYRPGTTNYQASIALQTETCKRADPATKPQAAVPVQIPNYIFRHTCTTRNRRLQAASELELIAFYFTMAAVNDEPNNSDSAT